MLSDGVILQHNNTHTARKTQELLRKFKWEICSQPLTAQTRHPIWVPNSYVEQLFSSESDVKTVVENWLNGQDVISAKPG
ncbi:hypothetical protein AVEN_203131-1 [Araneus ventricosus]|uniref:Tc1-like transposase DDE domain-containing protein n=1 Tax=Araneus ventricosus TaxID=182803 RepID=A0A4Y2B6K6_ARAVE|nr:hypothetical protein AVEN_203131-1 [Araneus ventricosus]